MGRGWLAATHPDDRDRVFDEWRAATQARRLFDCNYRYLSKAGNTVRVNVIAQAIAPNGDGSRGYIGVVQDVTENYEAAERLRESKGRRGSGQPREKRIPRNMSQRNPYADERNHRHDGPHPGYRTLRRAARLPHHG